MPGSLTIRQARLVLPDRVVVGDLVVEDGIITEIAPRASRSVGEEIDAKGLLLLPGAVDSAADLGGAGTCEDLESGTRAAAAGGITSVLVAAGGERAPADAATLDRALERAEEEAVVHHGFFVRAGAGELDTLREIERAAGILVDPWAYAALGSAEALSELFLAADKPIALWAEDPASLRERQHLYGTSDDPSVHPRLHHPESAVAVARLALDLSIKHGQRLHLLHLSSADEVELLRDLARDRITAGTSVAQLLLTAPEVYEQLGSRAVADPPLRTERHAQALWEALGDGTVDLVCSRHAPVSAAEKQGPYPQVVPGLPAIEWMLPLLLDRALEGDCTLQQVVRWTSSAPAEAWKIPRKGRLEVGYDADLVLVDPDITRTLTDAARSGCNWNPFAGRTVRGWPVLTILLGRPVFRDGVVADGIRGRALAFGR